METFVQTLKQEIAIRSNFFKARGTFPETIYFGGGTPSLLSPSNLQEIIEKLTEVNLVLPSHFKEVTMEVNPDDATFEYLSALKRIGITRLSMGIQSFQDEHLKWMNRRHDSKQALTAFENARRAGFDNISLDLIFGFEKLTNELWADNLKIITKLRPEHISAYQLSIEPDSVLGKMYDKGDYSLPDDDFCQRQYQFMQTHLADEGYNQYEVSNFSLKGRESMHNSSYWTHEPYLGLGPAAHSFDGRERSWNVSDIESYIDGIAKGMPSVESEILSKKDLINEKIMLRLRVCEGLNIDEISNCMSEEELVLFKEQVLKQTNKGNLILNESGKIKIPPEKLFVSDGIIRDLLL